MDTVEFNGVEYLKASVAARQFRYTQDYIGQLCRGKKIDARLVGRTWFVNPDSIKAHKSSRHQKTREILADEKSILEQNDHYNPMFSRKYEIAAPVRRAKTMNPERENEMLSVVRRLPVLYEPDDENLMPNILKKEQPSPKKIFVEHVSAQKLAIVGRRDEVSFVAEELPEVALSGAIKVTDYPESVTGTESEKQGEQATKNDRDIFKNKDISDNFDVLVKQENETDLSTTSILKEKTRISDRQSDAIAPGLDREGKHKFTVRNTDHTANHSELRPTSVTSTSFAPRIIERQLANKKVPTAILISPLIATLVALGCVVFILFASVSVTVSDTSYDSRLVFQVANLLELFNISRD